MVAILRDRDGRVLISQRPAGKPQAGRWEFPGGKLEAGEAPEAALRRELLEELGIVAGPMRPLIVVKHAYSDFTVELDVREVLHFGGAPNGREGQRLKWVAADDLPREDILEADRPIINAARLPDRFLITPDPATFSRESFLDALAVSLRSGIRLVQLRANSLALDDYERLAQDALALCQEYGARLLLNAAPNLLVRVRAAGIHLSARRARRWRTRPVDDDVWLSIACHSSVELDHAVRLDADFVLISPVAPTPTHPERSPLGWNAFRELTARAPMPVFALGGMEIHDIDRVRAAGGQGIAAIRAFWGRPLDGG